jgi:hypothetical protein
MGVFAALKKRWMAFALALGRVQTAILLFLVYVFALGPMAVLLRVFGRRDLLELRRPDGASFAHAKRQIPTDPQRCERPF